MFKIQFEIKSKMTAYVWAISGYGDLCASVHRVINKFCKCTYGFMCTYVVLYILKRKKNRYFRQTFIKRAALSEIINILSVAPFVSAPSVIHRSLCRIGGRLPVTKESAIIRFEQMFGAQIFKFLYARRACRIVGIWNGFEQF